MISRSIVSSKVPAKSLEQYAMWASSRGADTQTTLARSSYKLVSYRSIVFHLEDATDISTAIYMIAVNPAAYHNVPPGSGGYAALYASCVGWILLTVLLMFVSGLTLQERPGAKKRYEKGTGWPAYEKYLHDTSILIPMPPVIWRNLPVFVKRTIGLEFPIYVFDPAKHADQDKVQQREAEEGQSQSDGGARQSSEPLNG